MSVAAEHAEWHYLNGPSGPYGVSCPWDACGYAFEWDYEAEEAAREERALWASLAPELREGEEPAPLDRYGYKPDRMDAPLPWDYDPPF